MIWKFLFSYLSILSAATAIFWSLFNLYILFITLQDVLKRVYARKDYRFPVYLDAKITETTGTQVAAHIENISRSGVGLIEQDHKEIEDLANVQIDLPDGILRLPGDVVYKKVSNDGVVRYGIKFNELSTEDKKRLYKFLFVTAPRNVYDSHLESDINEAVADRIKSGSGNVSDFI